MGLERAAEILTAGGRLCDAAAVTTDGEVYAADPVLTAIVCGAAPYAEYGVAAGPGRVTKLALGSRVWQEIDCDLRLEERTELRVRVQTRLPPWLDGRDCGTLRALLGAETLPALEVFGREAEWTAQNGALVARFPSAGTVTENGAAVGFATGAVATVAGSACRIALRVNALPVGTPRAPIAGRAVGRTLGDRVATDGSATYRVSEDGMGAECDGATLKVYGARAFDVADGSLYGIGDGFVTDGTHYAAAPAEAPLEFRAIRQGGLRFFYRFADRWEVWNFEGGRLLTAAGAYERMILSPDYALLRSGTRYDLRGRDFQPLSCALFPVIFAANIEGEGFFGDCFYAVKDTRERLYCRLGDLDNFIFPAYPASAAAASNGFTAVYAAGSDVKVVVPDRITVTVAAGCGTVERLAIGRDCVYVWGDEGSAALYGSSWLTFGAGAAQCYGGGAIESSLELEAEHV